MKCEHEQSKRYTIIKEWFFLPLKNCIKGREFEGLKSCFITNTTIILGALYTSNVNAILSSYIFEVVSSVFKFLYNFQHMLSKLSISIFQQIKPEE